MIKEFKKFKEDKIKPKEDKIKPKEDKIKPKEDVDKMIDGRMKKFLNEVSLVGQPFVKDPNLTVADLLKQNNATVVSFVRYEAAEGIEKKVDNFAEEVMAQVKGH